jgi:hypothetical protein
LVSTDDVNILGGSIHNAHKITDALDVVSKEIGLEINDDKTKYLPCLEIRKQDEVKI